MTDLDVLKHNETDWNIVLTGETLLLNLIGKAFYTLPEKEWISTLVREGIFEEAPFPLKHPDGIEGLALLQKFCQDSTPASEQACFDEVRQDYTRLFIVPGKNKPQQWESVYLSGEKLIFQEPTLRVRNWYRCYGLQYEKLHNEPDDHIALELVFLAHLAASGVQALGEQDQDRFMSLLNSQAEFLSEHTLKWAPKFCNLVYTQASTNFYKGIAKLTRGILFDLAGLMKLEVVEGAV